MDRMTYFFKNNKGVEYNELNADSDLFGKFYEISNLGKSKLTAVPDGCIDIQCLWHEGDVRIVVCGSVKNGRSSDLLNYDKCFGARFKIGYLPSGIRENIENIVDNRIDLNCIMDTTLLEKYLSSNLLLEQKADIMLSVFEKSGCFEQNVVLDMLIGEIERKNGNVKIDEIIDRSGYSHRYVNYLFKNNVGLTVKRFSEIVRLQVSSTYLINNQMDMIYDELGYYDQSHFIRSYKSFTSLTPNDMKKNAKKLVFF